MFFGLNNIIAISLMSFLLGAIISILLILFKVKKSADYMPFGPFIVVATIITIFVPFEIILNVLMTIFMLGMNLSKNS